MSQIQEKLIELVGEASALRASLPIGEVTDGPSHIHADLLRCRQALDRVESILVSLLRLRAQARTQALEAKAAKDAAWNTAATKPQIGFKGPGDAAQERYAAYSLASLKEEIAWREAEKALIQVEASYDAVSTIHRGINTVRWTLDNRIRLITLETGLER